MFYAGQVAKKCKIELDRSEQRHDSWGKPRVKIVFTGKGSRIMDWFAAVNPQANKQYFEDLFMSGFGGIDEIRNHLSNVYIQARDDEASKEIKYEIAKGLVSTHPPGSEMMIPNDSNQIPLEIIGEEGLVDKEEDKSVDSDSSSSKEDMDTKPDSPVKIIIKKKKRVPNENVNDYEVGFQIMSSNDNKKYEVKISPSGNKRWYRV